MNTLKTLSCNPRVGADRPSVMDHVYGVHSGWLDPAGCHIGAAGGQFGAAAPARGLLAACLI